MFRNQLKKKSHARKVINERREETLFLWGMSHGVISNMCQAESLGINHVIVEYLSRKAVLGIDNTGCISGRDNSIFLNGDRLIATEEG
jgi:hypothetical protein